MNKIVGMEKLSLVDYAGKATCTIFTGGCNFNCPFCHNSSLVNDFKELNEFSFEEVFEYLEKRKGLLDAVCISGGEPTLYTYLEELVDVIKDMGYLIKLDTNGSNPEIIKKLINNKKIDYIAMDIKNSKEKYFQTIGIKSNIIMENITKSIQIIMNSSIDYEFRTTLVNELHSKNDMEEIGKMIKGSKILYLQKFMDHNSCIISGLHEVNYNDALEYKKILEKYIKKVELRSY